MRGQSVLDLSLGRAGAYCTRLLGTVGADVVVVEPPGGAPLRQARVVGEVSAAWEYLQAGKRSIELEDRSYSTLSGGGHLEGVDVVVVDGEGDLSELRSLLDELRQHHPNLVVAAVTPYGLEGPKSSWRATELEHWALAGHLGLNGEADRHPIPGGGPWLTHLVGAAAAIGVQAACFEARAVGHGDVIDVGALDVLVNGHQWSYTLLSHTGVVKQRSGNRFAEQQHPLALYPCTDGWVCIGVASAHQWEGLCIASGNVELLADDELYVPAIRFDRADELDAWITAWTSSITVDEAVTLLQSNQCPAGPVATFEDILEHRQLAARGYWTSPSTAPEAQMPAHAFVVPGVSPDLPVAPAAPSAPVRATARPVAAGSVAPLAGRRVIEFSVAWAGPMVGRILADLGAEVIKVEHPTARGLAMPSAELMASEAGDWKWGQLPGPLTRNGIFLNNQPGEDWYNRLGHWNKMNRGKRSVCLDVKADGGREVLEALVASADVVVNNYSPRGVRSLGIDKETLRAINPAIVTVDLSGYGAIGPDAELISWGPVLDAASGLASSSGYPDSGPYKQGIAFPDLVGGLHGTVATLGALWENSLTAEPVGVDFSQFETAIAVAGDQLLETSLAGEQPSRNGARSPDHAPVGVHPAAGDDAWLTISVVNDADWARLVGVVGETLDRPEWSTLEGRRRDHDDIDRAVTEWTSSRSKFDAVAELQAAGVPSAPVMSTADVRDDAQTVARGVLVDLARPGEAAQIFPGALLHFEHLTYHLEPAPKLGQDNTEVLEALGFDAGRIEELVAAEALWDHPPD